MYRNSIILLNILLGLSLQNSLEHWNEDAVRNVHEYNGGNVDAYAICVINGQSYFHIEIFVSYMKLTVMTKIWISYPKALEKVFWHLFH